MSHRSPLPVEAYANEGLARSILAHHLRGGSLSLLVGAGLSQDLGLPSWEELVSRASRLVGLTNSTVDGSTADALQERAEVIQGRAGKDLTHYREILTLALYQNFTLSPDSVISNLMVSLGCLIMGSSRGSVSDVLTLNYDNLLEWYLLLNGFRINVITEYPYLEGDEDVRIRHIQGYLPHPDSKRDPGGVPVLSLTDADRALGSLLEPWREQFRRLLATKVILVVGASTRTFRDRVFSPVFTELSDVLRPHGLTGVWLFGKPISDEQREGFLRSNIAPLVLEDLSRVPDFIFSVAREAAGFIMPERVKS